MSSYREIRLLVPTSELPGALNEAAPDDLLDAATYPVLSGAGLLGRLRVVQQAAPASATLTRLVLAEEDCPPGAWAPWQVVRADLGVPSTGGGVVSASLSVPGAVLGAPVLVTCGVVPVALAAVLQGAPWAWVSAADTVTVAVRVGALGLGATLPLYLYLLPTPP